jgi:hypothetical protein
MENLLRPSEKDYTHTKRILKDQIGNEQKREKNLSVKVYRVRPTVAN